MFSFVLPLPAETIVCKKVRKLSLHSYKFPFRNPFSERSVKTFVNVSLMPMLTPSHPIQIPVSMDTCSSVPNKLELSTTWPVKSLSDSKQIFLWWKPFGTSQAFLDDQEKESELSNSS